MKVLILLVCLSVGILATKPKKCRSPPLLSGQLSVSTSSEKLTAFAKYSYDACGKRIRLREVGSYSNKTFHIDLLLLYKEGVMYVINDRNRTCHKKPLNDSFHPMEVPQNASLLGQVVLGSKSGPREGLLVNTWVGELQVKNGTAKYMTTVTEFGCIPISTYFHTDKTGWIVTSFFNNIKGRVHHDEFKPPPFCTDAQLEDWDEENPVTFFSLF
uniref:ependymin-2-like isoform X1 n=1 Tax=Monopterus albus TaxID=43700 RepID=UPI0009B43A99|nr:ependymin-2-like isoform X1 [Monopterus albus]